MYKSTFFAITTLYEDFIFLQTDRSSGTVRASCLCNRGYEQDSLRGCVDIDECATRAHDCSRNGVCINQQGSFGCVCEDGCYGTKLDSEKSKTTVRSTYSRPARALRWRVWWRQAVFCTNISAGTPTVEMVSFNKLGKKYP